MSFIQPLLTSVTSEAPELDDDTAWSIVAVFEKHSGVGSELSRAEQVASFGWSEALLDATLDDAEVLQLRDALVARIRRWPHAQHVGLALWALGKLYDDSLLPVFVEALTALLAHDPVDATAVYQAMIALDNLEEHPFGDRQSVSAFDEQQNLADARAYLARRAG